MSGVAGARAFAGGAFSAEVLREMADLLHHRGPHSSDLWVGPTVGLAHTELTPGCTIEARQPLHSADGRWVLVLDGAVVNHQSLRAQLHYPFRTHSDVEVVLAGLALAFALALHFSGGNCKPRRSEMDQAQEPGRVPAQTQEPALGPLHLRVRFAD